MSAEDEIRGSGVREGAMQERFFDDLARGLASGAVSRRQTLRWMGGALVGAALASIPGISLAQGNSACAKFCHTVFRGRAAGRCTSVLGRALCEKCRNDPALVCGNPTSPEQADCCDPDKGELCCELKGLCVKCEEGEVLNPNTCKCVPAGQGPNPECAGATCQTFKPCSSGNPDCVCVSIESAEQGGGLCIPGSTECASLLSCGPLGACPEGQLCAVNTCCGDPEGSPVCVPVALECVAGQAAPITSAAAPEGPTIAGR